MSLSRSRPDCRCRKEKGLTCVHINTHSHIKCRKLWSLSLIFNRAPASRAALLMPPAESRGDQVSPTVQCFHWAALWCGDLHTGFIVCCLAGCKNNWIEFFFLSLFCSSWLLLIRHFCSSLCVISLKLKAQRRPRRHSKALNDIARQVGSNTKNLRQSLPISR